MSVTPDQFRLMQLRLAPRQPKPPQRGVDREADLHNAIRADCLRRGWLPNVGSMHQKTHRMPGEPDFTILAANGKVLFVECKARMEKLKPDQAAWHAWARKLGHVVYTVRTVEEWMGVAEGTNE